MDDCDGASEATRWPPPFLCEEVLPVLEGSASVQSFYFHCFFPLTVLTGIGPGGGTLVRMRMRKRMLRAD